MGRDRRAKREKREEVQGIPEEPHPAPGWERAVAGALLFAFVFLLGLRQITVSDTWWHLKTGELIMSSGIPRVDPFSYVLEGRPWVAFEWLSQALFFELYSLGGAAALTGFKSLLLASAFLLLWGANADRPSWSAGLVALAALGCRDQFVERPYIFDLFFLSALLAALWRIPFRDPPKALFWGVPLGTALWANLHGGAALLAPVFIAVSAAAERLRDREVPLARWAALAAISAACVLLTPHGFALLGHFRETLSFSAGGTNFEWRPPSYQYREIYGPFLAAGAAALWPTVRRRPFAAAWLILSAVASLRMQRNIPLYLIAAAPVAAGAYAPRFLQGSRPAALALLAPALAAAFWLHTFVIDPSLAGVLGVGARIPFSGASGFLERNAVSGRMFNEFISGGALIWHGYPRRKVFIDNRDVDYGREHVRAALRWHKPENWRALDAKFDFDYALIRRHPSGAYTSRALDESPAWRLVYWDDEAMIYLKDKPANAELIGRYGYSRLKPGQNDPGYLAPVLSDPARGGELVAELDRAIAEAPDCFDAVFLKAFVLAQRGELEEALAAARRGAERFPKKARLKLILGWIHGARGELAQAEAVYTESLAHVSRDERALFGADILVNLGLVREKQGEREGALRLWKKALRWNPAHPEARARIERAGV